MSSPVSERLLPHSLEAERAILGSVLLDDRVLDATVEVVSGDDFFSEAHRIILAAMVALAGGGHTVNSLTLLNRLASDGVLEKMGGAGYLGTLTDGLPVGTEATVGEYARIVKEKSITRRLINASQGLVARCLEGTDSAEDLLAHAEESLGGVRELHAANAESATPLRRILLDRMPQLERTAGASLMVGSPTGFARLDEATAGWVPGEYVILAGRPSQGKSSLALEFAIRAAQAGKPVAFFSLETNKSALLIRMLCLKAKINSWVFRSGWLTKAQWAEVARAGGELSNLPIWIDDRGGVSVYDLRWRIRSLARRIDAKLVIVDYLGLLRAKAENRTQEVGKISIELQTAAKELGNLTGGTLIALCQLSRLAAEERPQLHHLRDSGSLEQDTDMVLFISDDPDNPPILDEHGHIISRGKFLDIAKQKSGPQGTVLLNFYPPTMAFKEPKGEFDKADAVDHLAFDAKAAAAGDTEIDNGQGWLEPPSAPKKAGGE